MTEPTTIQMVVAGKTPVARGVVAVTFRAADGRTLPAWEPGAHVDLGADGPFERQYSLCGDRADAGSWRIAVLREADGRGGSAWVHDGLAVGDAVAVCGPRNAFALVDAVEYLFIAGGIGITPLLPMIAAAEAWGIPWRLLYGGRERASMAFLGELERYGDRVMVRPADEHGLLDLEAALADHAPGLAVYACGPEVLLEAVEERCEGRAGLTLHVERFRPRPGALDGARTSFEVVLELSGLSVTVGPDESIVDAVTAAGVDVPTSCREGTCGTCETAVIEGEIDHRDSFLSPEEQESGETMMVCCSRARSSRLVLEL